MYVLKKPNTQPPGGYPYLQTEGLRRYFPAEGLSIRQQAERVLDFRKGNKLPRASLAEVIQDIVLYTCARLGNDPKHCYETDKSFEQVLVMAVGRVGCGGCLK